MHCAHKHSEHIALIGRSCFTLFLFSYCYLFENLLGPLKSKINNINHDTQKGECTKDKKTSQASDECACVCSILCFSVCKIVLYYYHYRQREKSSPSPPSSWRCGIDDCAYKHTNIRTKGTKHSHSKSNIPVSIKINLVYVL